MRRLFLLSLVPALALGVFSCARIERPVSVPVVQNFALALRPVRVLVGTATLTQKLDVSAQGKAGIWADDGKTLLAAALLDKAPVTVKGGAVVVGGQNLARACVILAGESGGTVQVGANSYPGQIVLVARGESVIAVNYVSMEDYVAGVVSCEMPPYFERAALEAQAVAARTYALWTMKHTRLLSYDLKDDTSSQVYRGVTGTSAYGREAARRTAGITLIYEWAFLPSFFFSTCGGHTAVASQMRGAPLVDPLSGVECQYCRLSKYYHWARKIPAAEVETALAKGGVITGKLLDISVTKTVSEGWVDTVTVTTTDGVRLLTGYALRQYVGTSQWYSTNFKILRSGEDFVIEGRGLGHGVGLCQWGADGMARQGYNYAQILRHYYPGAGILKIY